MKFLTIKSICVTFSTRINEGHIVGRGLIKERIMKRSVVRINLKFFVLFLAVTCIFPRIALAEGLLENQSKSYFKEALEAQKSGDFDSAAALYMKAIYSDEKYVKAYNNFGTAYAQKGDLVKAEEEYNKAIAIDPYYSTALKNLALIYAEKGDYDKFYEYWKRATGLDMQSPFLVDVEED
jgi:tetratricopeptide (TPR) repeat protein